MRGSVEGSTARPRPATQGLKKRGGPPAAGNLGMFSRACFKPTLVCISAGCKAQAMQSVRQRLGQHLPNLDQSENAESMLLRAEGTGESLKA